MSISTIPLMESNCRFSLFILFFFSVSPEITLQDKYYVGREKSVSLDCKVEGYPTATITWTPCNLQCDKRMLNISEVSRNEIYTCTAKNSLGNATKNTSLGKSVLIYNSQPILQLWVEMRLYLTLF